MLLCMMTCLFSVVFGSSVHFDVLRKGEKCVADDISKDTLVILEYDVLDGSAGKTGVSMLLRDPSEKYIKEDHNIDLSDKDVHKVTFTATEEGYYTCCFYNNNDKTMRVMMDLKHGVEAKDYSDLAKKEHLAPVEQELRKMEDTIGEIHREMLYMRTREAAMRNTNESTNARVLYFSFFSIVVLCGMGTWQVMYLKKFFRAKKLI